MKTSLTQYSLILREEKEEDDDDVDVKFLLTDEFLFEKKQNKNNLEKMGDVLIVMMMSST